MGHMEHGSSVAKHVGIQNVVPAKWKRLNET
jgi:hypothetical protein